MSERVAKRPLETLWVTRADTSSDHFFDCLNRLGGSNENVDPYFRGDVIINGMLREVRGKAKVLFYEPKDREDFQERMERAGLRIWTQEEQDAYEKLPGFELGGVNHKTLPTEEDVVRLKKEKEAKKSKETLPLPRSVVPDAHDMNEDTRDQVLRQEDEGGPVAST